MAISLSVCKQFIFMSTTGELIMATKKSTLPSVLAFEKKLVPSNGFMYGTTWEKRFDKNHVKPLKIQEKSVRGTISNRLNKAIAANPLKLDAEVQKPNLQTVDSCALSVEQDTLKLQFTLKVLSDIQTPSTCNLKEFEESYASMANQYIENIGFGELAKRYATNIATGRFLWRNRVGVQRYEILVKHINSDQKSLWKFNEESGLTLKDFNNSTDDLTLLANEIEKALSSKAEFNLFEITAYVQVGQAQDIYPSEELVLDKNTSNKGKKSKVLYQVNEIAAMHSQKIGNAIRTIDTWYPEAEENNQKPIAVEIYGSVTNLGRAYRHPKQKADFYTLFDQFATGGTISEEEQHYIMAVLVRGGVFGESSKE